MLSFTTIASYCLPDLAGSNATKASEGIACGVEEMKEMHFDDFRKTEQHLSAVKKLGCEAFLDLHNSHTDVICRSAKWQASDVGDDKFVHQWERWLKKAGFETLDGHSVDYVAQQSEGEEHDHFDHGHLRHHHAAGDTEDVAYPLPNWRLLHTREPAELKEPFALMKGLSSDVQSENHGGHMEVRIPCSRPKQIEFTPDKAAARWNQWLGQNRIYVTPQSLVL